MIRKLLAFSLLAVALHCPAQAPDITAGMKWREVGPARGGRSVACAGSQVRPEEYYFGATGGGIWKTTNAGKEWNCVSDGFLGTASVGALAIDPKNPDIVYAGMGEKDIRGNISHGDGMYKTTDGGKTWKHIGLRETQTIARIVIDPTDTNTLYVAALGHIYGPNKERGLYKSTDAGETWTQVLFESEKAGAIDIELDPFNSKTLYAATWEAWRTPYTLNSGGPGSKLWKSTDAGKTWTNLSANPGLPKGVLGKIGVSPSPAKKGRIYAIIEAHEGGVFRSDDSGATWTLTNDSREWRQRAWYYTHIIADPKNADGVWVLNVSVGRSTDGGKTFTQRGAGHSDNHDMWIAPNDPDRMIVSNDGSACVTSDGGSTWSSQAIPTAQIYHISTDNAWPYRLLGAQQDNSTIRILNTARPSTTPSRGGTPDWTGTAGGESGYVVAKPNDPDIVFGGNYGGDLDMLNHRTNQRRGVNPWPDMAMGRAAVDLDERFQWTFPIVFSPHNPDLMYTCSQHVFKTLNGGETWTKISLDLSKNDPRTLQSSGGPITKDNTSVEYYGTVFTLAESPLQAGILWAGSDDGLVHVSQDAGGSWQKITPKGMPEWGLCSMIEASPHDKASAFLAVDNHENDDYSPYIYRTSDFGKKWTKVVNGIPAETFVRVVREDPLKPGLLFAGTERGVYYSTNYGDNWKPLQMNLPLTPVHDLVIKNSDLCIATHGRGFWILDDISPLRQSADLGTDRAFLFRPRDNFRPGPVSFAYYLPKEAKKVAVEIVDGKGEVVARSENLETNAGLQRFSAQLRYPGYRGFPGMIFWGGGGGSIPAAAGLYTIRLDVDGQKLNEKIRLKLNPNSTTNEADTVAQTEFARRVAARVQEANDAVSIIRELKKAIDASGGSSSDADALKKQLSAVEEEIYQVRNRSGQDPLNYPVKLNNRLAGLFGEILSGDFPPSDQSYQVFGKLTVLLQVQLDALEGIRKGTFARFNDGLRQKGKKVIEWPKPVMAESTGRGRRGD
ncbi:MAG: hypothetical protein K1X67_01080 [Fimbriimonadaceae bacterium]|nr:hypothetical protein [Fimbriimonadaceae bacterium]